MTADLLTPLLAQAFAPLWLGLAFASSLLLVAGGMVALGVAYTVEQDAEA